MQQVLGAKQQGHAQRRGEEDRRRASGRLLVAATEGEGKKKATEDGKCGKYSVGVELRKKIYFPRAGAPVGSFAGRFDKDS